MKFILELEEQGYNFWLEGEKIQFEYRGLSRPKPALVKPLLEGLKVHKVQAVKFLQNREQAQLIDFESEVRKARMALGKQGIVRLHSSTLEEDVYWAKNDREAEKASKGTVVYTLDELKHLVDLKTNPESLKRIHEAKKIFGGKLRGCLPPGGDYIKSYE